MSSITRTDDRVVAFVDILGWKNAFKTIGHKDLVGIAMEIASHKSNISKAKSLTSLDVNFSFFSDSFVVSSSLEHTNDLIKIVKWDCMILLQTHGLLTRGGITMGEFTHDMENDILVGEPLNNAAEIEKSTKMPRVQVSDDVFRVISEQDKLYFDGEHNILNIANISDCWLFDAQKKIHGALNSELGAYEKCKWKYISEHLPRMHNQLCAQHQ